MIYLQSRWIASNNIGFKDGLRKPMLFPRENVSLENTMANPKKLIAVVGASGQQGGSVVRALQASGEFTVRALTRDPAKHPNLAEEVVAADLNRPETLKAAF